MTTAIQIERILRAGAEAIRETLGREDDWTPVVAFTDRDGTPHMIDASALMLPDLQLVTIEAVASVLVARGARNVGFIHPVWSLRGLDARDFFDGDAVLRPRDNPNRQEELQIITIDGDGRMACLFAPVTRSSAFDHPRLGEWERLPDDTEYEGLMVDPLKAALTLVREEEAG